MLNKILNKCNNSMIKIVLYIIKQKIKTIEIKIKIRRKNEKVSI